jgi:PKD repeat protein
MTHLARSGVILLAALAWLAGSAPAHAQSWTGTWTKRAVAATPAKAPGLRGWVDLAFDSDVDRPVLFGGSGGVYYNDVLNIDFASGRWVEVEPYQKIVAPSGPPCGRDEHAVVFDPHNGLLWSFGGSGFACGSQSGTIAAGSTTTTIIDPALPDVPVDFYRDYVVTVTATPAYYTNVAGYDPSSKTLTLATPVPTVVAGRTYKLTAQFGGGTWSYDTSLRRWRGFADPSAGYEGASPRSRLSPAFAYSTSDDAAVMFGGQVYNDTWVLDAITQSWVQMRADGSAGSPPRRTQVTSSMAYDEANDAFVLFGGRCTHSSGCNGTAYGQPLNDTWIYRIATNAWTRMFPPVSPAARNQHALSYDAVNGVVVLFGGSGAATYNDTWTYSVAANTWTQVSTPLAPDSRRLHAMVYDPSIGEHVIYGGVKGSGAGTNEVWTLRLAPSGANVPPSASFTVNPASGPPSTSFAFNGSPSTDTDGTIVSFAWDFGDGSNETGASPTHTYAGQGVYTVTLTVTDNQGDTGTTSSSVLVTAPNVAPTARISVTQTANDSFAFGGDTSTDADGAIVSYAWNFGDGATATGISASHRYAVPRAYTVQLTVTDNGAATNSATTTVQASAPVVISLAFTQRVTGTVAGGGPVTAVTANGIPVAFTNGPGGVFEFTLSAAVPTTFSVVVSASGTAGTTATSTFTVVVP